MTTATRRRPKTHPLMRRYGPGVAILLGTAVFVVLIGFLGFWMIHTG